MSDKQGSPLDTLSPKERSERMSRVRHKDTKLELAVRRLIYRMGYRYRLQVRDLPGNPDIVFPGRKKVIFIHGCFWHRHPTCHNGTRLPKSKLDFWVPKLESNRRRDEETQRRLRDLGWEVLVIWECEVKKRKMEALEERIRYFLEMGDEVG